MEESISKIKLARSKNRRLVAFVFLFVVGLAIASAQLFKSYTINSGYKSPSPLLIYPTLFEYAAFSFIALLFPWSWKTAAEKPRLRIVRVVLTGLCFVLSYIFVLALLEWIASSKNYHLWNGYTFSLYHSGLLVLLIYFFISLLLLLLGVVKNQEQTKYLKRISYKSKGRTSYIEVSEIQLFEANDNYVSVYLGNNQHHLIRQTLLSFEKQLDPAMFQRVHRKYIINISTVSSWKTDPNGGYTIYLTNGQNLKMSKGYKEKLKLLTENS